MAFHVIIPAAGHGSRMQSNLPKQYLLLNGRPLIAHVLDLFANTPLISQIHLVLAPDDQHWQSLVLPAYPTLQVHKCGSDTRANTVRHTLKAIQHQVATDDWILVHDAVRPGLSQTLLQQFIHQLAQHEVGGLLALPACDTLKQADGYHQVKATLPRQHIWQAQTPQMFRYALLQQAMACFDGTPTDEAEAIEALGYAPQLVMGEQGNLKVTHPADLIQLEALMKASKLCA